MDISEWKERLKKHREEKDSFFSESSRSPIPSQKRENFEDLNYYPLDPKYRFELQLYEHDDKEEIEIDTTGDEDRGYIRWGEFRFEAESEQQVLHAYKKESEESFFVPFRDSTSGDETYGAGRYMDLDESKHLGEGRWIVDFNEAYNPWCAYSDSYSCPLPPPENWLEIPIRAGEKKPLLKE